MQKARGSGTTPRRNLRRTCAAPSEVTDLSGIRTAAAAELLGVSPSTLRTWERRLGYPQPERTSGNHRQYSLDEIEALREALRETGNISSAVDVARRRGRGPASPARLVAAFDRFDEPAADRELEESLAVRSVERTVEEVLLPALELAAERKSAEAEAEHASRWAVGWLHSARRLVPPATRSEGVLLLDSGTGVGREAVETQALELFLRRAGLRVLLLSADLPEARFARALRALEPRAAVLCGTEARLDVLGPQLRRVLSDEARARLLSYRSANLVSGRSGLPSLGSRPSEATASLLGLVAQGA
ncbi:MAG: MerR family DNA-binding transcriptional regulator [Solirubrobacterales bacterium]